jgi:hypothetical protein
VFEVAKIFSGDSEIVELLSQKHDFTKFEENGFETEADYRAQVEYENNETKRGLVKHMAKDFVGMFMCLTSPRFVSLFSYSTCAL